LELNLTGQEVYAQDIQPKVNQLKTLMNERKVLWDRLSNEKKKVWITSGKDPIMTLAWNAYSWLRDNFFGDYANGDY